MNYENGEKIYHQHEKFDLKIQNLGKPACHFMLGMATYKTTDKQLTHQNDYKRCANMC